MNKLHTQSNVWGEQLAVDKNFSKLCTFFWQGSAFDTYWQKYENLSWVRLRAYIRKIE
jgi:hypothetical protein